MYAVRFALGMSQRDAAKCAGVSEDTWGKGEAGGALKSGVLTQVEAFARNFLTDPPPSFGKPIRIEERL
jgi:transcriptional regulator with XRE-family HTH domain